MALTKVRFGVVGLGNMGLCHATGLAGDDNPDVALGAVWDIDRDKARRIGQELGTPSFANSQKMFESGLVDAVIVAAPHYWHAPLTIRAARAGLHVLCEKPMAVSVGPARAMVAECKARNVALGVMFQSRTRMAYHAARHLVQSGALGEVFRVQMLCSAWYRSQAYYNSGSWRGTWDGEGGGVLINQAPHSLDLFQWIGGMPTAVIATVGTRAHNIEVEDTVNAICEYGGGKMGYIYATTADAPGIDQLTLCGDKATLVIEEGKLRIARLTPSLTEHLLNSPEVWGKPEAAWADLSVDDQADCPAHFGSIPGDGKHADIIGNFAAHVLRGEPLCATGESGINGLELSNAIYIAGYRGKRVDLPVDAAEMERLLAQLEKRHSTGRGGRLRTRAAREMRKLQSQ